MTDRELMAFIFGVLLRSEIINLHGMAFTALPFETSEDIKRGLAASLGIDLKDPTKENG